METPIAFTVSAFDRLYGQRVNCGSYLTMAEALAYVDRQPNKRSEYDHAIHVNELGRHFIDYSTIVWRVLRNQEAR